jgi:hypothetical protein
MKHISLETDDGDDEFDLTMVAEYQYKPAMHLDIVANSRAGE